MAEVYKIQVAIGATNNISPVLAMIAKDFTKLDGLVGGIGKGMAAWAGLMAADQIVKGLIDIAKHGGKLLDQQDQLRRNGIAQNEVLALTAEAYNRIAKAVPTADAVTILKTTRELRAVTGSTEAAIALTPKALMTDALLSNTYGHEVHGEYYKLSRSAEMKGISTDQAKLDRFTDQFFSFIVAFGGKLKTEDVQALARRGGTSWINAKPESLGPLAVLAADLGGATAGTAQMTLQQLQLGANTLTKQQASTLSGLHLLDMSKAHATGFGGGKLQLDPGAMVGSQQYTGDIPGWIKNVVWPAILKEAHGDPALAQSLLAKIAPNRNAQKLIQMYGDEGFTNQISKDLALAGQVQDIPTAYSHFTKDNPAGVELAYEEQKKSMLEAIGAPLMQAALPVMRSITEMFTSIGAVANANNSNITAALGAISEAFKMIWQIDSALLSAAGKITGVSGVFQTLADLPWETLRHGLAAVNDGMNSIGNTVERIKGMFSGTADKSNDEFSKGLKEGYMPMSFNPGSKGMLAAQPIALSLNVDGKTLAQAVSDQLMYLYEHPTRGPSGDGQGQFNPPANKFGA
jgi:hypothetical protein